MFQHATEIINKSYFHLNNLIGKGKMAQLIEKGVTPELTRLWIISFLILIVSIMTFLFFVLS